MNIYNYFDSFALIFWIFLFIDALIDMKKGRKDWRVILRLLIGLCAFIIDLALVIWSP